MTTATMDRPDEAYLCALTSLPGISVRHLSRLLAGTEPEEAWNHVCRARYGTLMASPAGGADDAVAVTNDVLRRWAEAARHIDPDSLLADHVDAGVIVAGPGHPAWPQRFVDDPEPPAVVFLTSQVPCAPTVAIVGTRRSSGYGRSVAHELGEALGHLGVQVVSGVAAGIDATAQRAALPGAATVIGVVGSGLDVVYPARNRELWHDLRRSGALLSEWPLGTSPAPWRFPARNRLIAALADVVVVVESRERGGSMYTVEEALRRDRMVMAVPGPIRSVASAGTNRLIRDGAAPMCSVDDVLVALGLTGRPPVAQRTGPDLSPVQDRLLDLLGWQPVTFDELVAGSGLALSEVASGLAQLESAGLVVATSGWWERA